MRRRRGRGQAVQDGKLLFLIAGIPAAMATLFGQRIQDWFSPVVWMPLPPKDRVYTGRYVALLYERFADSVRKLAKNNQSHGAFRPDFYGDHDVWCFPRSRLRLGASFDSSFHYDCCVADSRRLPTSWRGCHQQPVSTNRSENYVNIYPNDYVR